MKHWIARIILTLGYTSIGLLIGSAIYTFYKPLGLIIGVVTIALLWWIIVVWLLHLFVWAHKNWRKI